MGASLASGEVRDVEDLAKSGPSSHGNMHFIELREFRVYFREVHPWNLVNVGFGMDGPEMQEVWKDLPAKWGLSCAIV